MGASFPIVAQTVPDLFLGLLIVGDGKRFEVEANFTGALGFDEARRDVGEFNRWLIQILAVQTERPEDQAEEPPKSH